MPSLFIAEINDDYMQMKCWQRLELFSVVDAKAAGED